MAFSDLFKIYPNRNMELRAIAKQMYEFGKTIAREPSAAHSSGLDLHAIHRQREYVAHSKAQIAALFAKPIPDLPATHPLALPINLSEVYTQFVIDVNGENVPLNEMTEMLAEMWMVGAVEVSSSQSAALAGALVEFDFNRANNNLDVIAKLLDEIEARPVLDLPETAAPGAELTDQYGSNN